MSDSIQVWRYHDAPEDLKALGCSDDTDWLALVPSFYLGEAGSWWDHAGTPFALRWGVEIPLADGSVFIGYHS